MNNKSRLFHIMRDSWPTALFTQGHTLKHGTLLVVKIVEHVLPKIYRICEIKGKIQTFHQAIVATENIPIYSHKFGCKHF